MDATHAALAAAFRTVDLFTTGRHLRMLWPLTGRPSPAGLRSDCFPTRPDAP